MMAVCDLEHPPEQAPAVRLKLAPTTQTADSGRMPAGPDLVDVGEIGQVSGPSSRGNELAVRFRRHFLLRADQLSVAETERAADERTRPARRLKRSQVGHRTEAGPARAAGARSKRSPGVSFSARATGLIRVGPLQTVTPAPNLAIGHLTEV